MTASSAVKAVISVGNFANMSSSPIIKTNRLILRPTVVDDARDIQRYFNNWEIIKWLQPPVPWPYPDDGAITYLRDIEKRDGYKSFSIMLKEKSKIIGTIRFECHECGKIKYAERGFFLSQEHWNKGIMSEASSAINNFIFGTTDAQEIWAYNSTQNKKSRKIKEKQNFKMKEILKTKHPYHCGDKQEEKWILKKSDWIKLNEIKI